MSDQICRLFKVAIQPGQLANFRAVAHVKSFGQFAERFHVYGPARDEVKAILADFDPIYFSSLGGFSR